MRRSDREITDPAHIDSIVNTARFMHVAYCDEAGITMIPITYVAEKTPSGYVLWAHGAKDGRKFKAFSAGVEIAFEINIGIDPIFSEDPKSNSWKFQTVIGNAKSSVVEDMSEKQRVFALLVEHHTCRPSAPIDPMMAEVTALFRFEVTSLSAKERK